MKPKANKKNSPWPWWRKLVFVVGIIALTIGIGFWGYFVWNASHLLTPNTAKLTAASSNQSVIISRKSGYIEIKPVGKKPNIGLILYPGAFVDPKGYIALYSRLAESGEVSVFILQSPLGFGLLNIGQGEEVMQVNPTITHWFVAGHSLGGVAACEFSKDNKSVNGLILLGSYCNSKVTNQSLPVISISGMDDALTNPSKIDAAKSKLPSAAQFVAIPGLNHTDFGDFATLVNGDRPSSTPAAQTQAKLIMTIQEFITQNSR